MKRILLISIFAAFTVSAGEPPRTDSMADSPMLNMHVSSRVLVSISSDGKVHVEDGVTAQEIAEAWYKSSFAQQARAERCEAFVRDFFARARKTTKHYR